MNAGFALRIITLAALLGFTMAACPNYNGDTGNPDGRSAFFGDGLVISGEQVYKADFDFETCTLTYAPYTGPDLTLPGGTIIGGIINPCAEIKNGKLSVTLETPGYLYKWDDLRHFIINYHSDIIVSDDTVKGNIFMWFSYYDAATDTHYDLLPKTDKEIEIDSASGMLTTEYLLYIYVDKDITVSGTGKTTTYYDNDYPYTVKDDDFALALKAGWNAVLTKYVNFNMAEIKTLSPSDSSRLRWVLFS